MTEHKIYIKVKLALPTILLQRIEYQRVPDIFFRSETQEGWIELKCLPTITYKVTIPFRPGQFSWIRDYIRKGGTAYLFCSTPDQLLWIFKNKDIYRSYTNKEFAGMVHTVLDLRLIDASRLLRTLGG